jgi:hypothetical protein
MLAMSKLSGASLRAGGGNNLPLHKKVTLNRAAQIPNPEYTETKLATKMLDPTVNSKPSNLKP